MKTYALLELFLEIEKHALYRAHANLVKEAREEMLDILATDKRLVQAALGRGMASEMDNIEEVAVLVCGLHDKIDRLEKENRSLDEQIRGLSINIPIVR
jgi:hypothetical protein